MAQIINHENSSLLSEGILNLVNERLLQPKQPPVSKLENYFLGYKEFLKAPPSPTLSEPDQLFSYSQNRTNPDEVPNDPLQNPPGAQSRVTGCLRRTNQKKSYYIIRPQRRKGTKQKESRGYTRSYNRAGRIVKESSSHGMETRSRAAANRRKELERGRRWSEIADAASVQLEGIPKICNSKRLLRIPTPP